MKRTVGQIAEHIGAKVRGDADRVISGVAPMENATVDTVTFAEGGKYLNRINTVPAGAVIVPPTDVEADKPLLLVDNPKKAFAQVIGLFHPPARPPAGVDARAAIGEHFTCGEGVSIGPMVAIGDHVTLGDRVVLHPGVVLGDGVTVGHDTLIYPNVSILSGCRIGSRVILHAGSVIGSDGYGFCRDGQGHFKIPQVGTVQIDDDVEIGANCTIDRATLGVTRIHSGVKTDNQVHIGHNVTVGRDTLIVAQAGVAGSTRIGKGVIIAGGAAITDHITIGDGAIVGPMTGVAKSVPDGHIVSGIPEMPHRTWLKVHRVLPDLPAWVKRVRALEKHLTREGS